MILSTIAGLRQFHKVHVRINNNGVRLNYQIVLVAFCDAFDSLVSWLTNEVKRCKEFSNVTE